MELTSTATTPLAGDVSRVSVTNLLFLRPVRVFPSKCDRENSLSVIPNMSFKMFLRVCLDRENYHHSMKVGSKGLSQEAVFELKKLN